MTAFYSKRESDMLFRVASDIALIALCFFCSLLKFAHGFVSLEYPFRRAYYDTLECIRLNSRGPFGPSKLSRYNRGVVDLRIRTTKVRSYFSLASGSKYWASVFIHLRSFPGNH